MQKETGFLDWFIKKEIAIFCALKCVIIKKDANIDLDAEEVVISDEVVQKMLDLQCLLFWHPHERSHEQN